MRIIILGCGYLGYNLHRLLSEHADCELWGIESPYSALAKDMVYVNAFDEAAMAEHDFRDAAVIDAIGLIANNAMADDEAQALEQIRKPYRRLLQTLKDGGAGLFVFFSSGGTIYGNTNQPIREEDPIAPQSLYARSKAAIEDLIRNSALPYLILRLSNPYGGYQIAEKKQGVIPILIRKALLGEPFELFARKDSIRDYFYITDLAAAVSGLLEHQINNETVNIGSGKGTSLQTIIDMVEEETGKQIPIITKETAVPMVQSIVLNIDRLKQYTGFEPSVSLREGIALETARIKKEMKL